jgi:aspartate carbamoyltransferase catalytic subunit
MSAPRHILGVRQFDRAWLEMLFARADAMQTIASSDGSARLTGRIMASLFFEPSTRTRLSFESAMTRLGGSVLSAEDAGMTSSVAKGETIEDSVRIVESYADLLVIRHPQAGAVARAAAVVDVPVINAGDGTHEHPTQALLDLYTIYAELGRIDGLRIALVGDLKYGRAVRSLSLLMAQTRDNELIFISPPGVRMGDDVKGVLHRAGVQYREETDLRRELSRLDVLYQTRIQRERFSTEADYHAAWGRYVIDSAMMAEAGPRTVLMHPLPRVDEITPEVDVDPRAAYFRQARNGVYVRMALLDVLLGESTGG